MTWLTVSPWVASVEHAETVRAAAIAAAQAAVRSDSRARFEAVGAVGMVVPESMPLFMPLFMSLSMGHLNESALEIRHATPGRSLKASCER